MSMGPPGEFDEFETTPDEFDEMLEQSSLGTANARAIAALTPPAVVEFARTRAEGGRFDGIVDLTRLTDGSVMCCLCFDYTARDALWTDPAGQQWDLCVPCGEREAERK